jgi:hypothetical protein
MKQPIANIILKLDKNGSSVQLKNVTPAEVMLLCAMHHTNAGGDPVVKLTEIPVDAFEEEQSKQVAALKKLEEDYAKVELDPTLLEDVREKRLESIQKRMDVKQSLITGYSQIAAIRELSPADEYQRLSFKYNNLTLKAFYPGRIPSLPATFEEARRNGVSSTVEESKWLVGAAQLAKANG